MRIHTFLLLGAGLLTACGGNTQISTQGTGGTSTGGTGGSTSTGGTGGASTGGTSTGGTSTGGTSTGGTGGGDGSCTAGVPCPGGGACLFPQGSCDPGAKGSCQLGFTCDGPPTGPLCKCDGTVLEGEMAECTVWGMSQPYANPDACAKGTFTCGSLQCKRNVEVCVKKQGGPAGNPPSYDCTALADIQGTCAHGIADCSCLDGTSVGCSPNSGCCTADAEHQETLTINLP